MTKDIQKLFEEFIDECQYSKRLRPETIKGYKEVFRHFTASMPELASLEMLTTQMMTQFFKRLQTRERIVGVKTKKVGVKDSTIKTYWSRLNTFFDWLQPRGYIKENPLKAITPPTPIYDDKRAIVKSDIEKVIAAVSLHSPNSLTSKRDMAMIFLLLYAGLRKGEFISLHVKDIDMENQLITIRGETSKSKVTHQVPIHPMLLFHLKEYIAERNKKKYKTEYLIVSTTTDKGLSRDGLKHWVTRLNALSGVDFHLHQFRHSFACNLALQNTSAVKIQKLMGHADLRMTMTYLRSLNVADMDQDIRRLNLENFI